MGDFVILLLVGCGVVFAVRSLRKNQGRGCSGSCAGCQGCLARQEGAGEDPEEKP